VFKEFEYGSVQSVDGDGLLEGNGDFTLFDDYYDGDYDYDKNHESLNVYGELTL
jgi:hypothetical protein